MASLTTLAGAIGVVACITAPPPDLPVTAPHRPTILHGSVDPSAGAILDHWPGTFVVPVEVYDPNQHVYWEVFIDFHPKTSDTPFSASMLGYHGDFVASPAVLDGGIRLVPFDLTLNDLEQLGQAGPCHTIQFLVANGFNGENSAHTPDSLGGDSVEWIYQPGGAGSCDEYDAGDLQDGAFPSGDAPTDALPLTPDSVGPL